MDDTAARQEWGWNPQWDLDRMTQDMLKVIKEKHENGFDLILLRFHLPGDFSDLSKKPLFAGWFFLLNLLKIILRFENLFYLHRKIFWDEKLV